MAPLRSRANRNQGDDETSILKGLPIRQWRLTEEKIGPPMEAKTPEIGKQTFPELPLPRDFNLLPEISQQLLRKARAGVVFRPPTPPPSGKEGKLKDGKDEGGFVSKKWTIVSREKEGEEPTHLAKRRKGLPASFSVNLAALVPQASFRQTKVKKYDADGTLHVYEVLAPEGHHVEGEIVGDDEAAKAAPVETMAAAPGTVVEGVGVVNEQGVVVSNDLLAPTPPRRKPPPPRRKPKKGPGRGKKKVAFEGTGPISAQDLSADGMAFNASQVSGLGESSSSLKEASAAPSAGEDTPMLEAGDDDEGSGSEGDGDDDDDVDREEGELSPSPEPQRPSTSLDTENRRSQERDQVESKNVVLNIVPADDTTSSLAAVQFPDVSVASRQVDSTMAIPAKTEQPEPLTVEAATGSQQAQSSLSALATEDDLYIEGSTAIALESDVPTVPENTKSDDIVKEEFKIEPEQVPGKVETVDVVSKPGLQEPGDNKNDVLGSLEAALNEGVEEGTKDITTESGQGEAQAAENDGSQAA